MTPEQKMLKTLVSREEGTENLASKSAEELELMLKQANPAIAALGTHAVGGLLGYSRGKAQKARGEKHTFGGAQLAGALLLPGGLGYQVGRAIAHENGNHDSTSKSKKANGDMLQYFQDHPEKLKEKQERDAKKEKKSSAEELVQLADSWGRELAQKEKVAISFNQVNEGSKFVGRLSRLWEKHGPALKSMAGKAGKAAHEGVKNVGSQIGNIKDPIVKGMATGGAIGGVGGAAQGFLDPKENPYTGEKQRLRTAFRKGLAGTAGGMVSGALIGSMGKSASVKRLEKAAGLLNAGGISSMAKNFVGSMGATAHKALNAATPALQSGVKALGNASMGQAAGVGAAGGAALGAAKGFVAPGQGPNGQKRSRLGGAARGAVGGAALGAGVGAGAKAALPHVQQFATKKLLGA